MSFEDEINETISNTIDWRDEMRKKRGRPIPEGGVRDRIVMVRLNEMEEDILNKLAERAGIPRTEYVRLLIWEQGSLMSLREKFDIP